MVEKRSYPVPETEKARLETLRSYQILDSMPEKEYDDIVFLASYICQTPMASITFIDDDRQWFKSRSGMDDPETARELSFCSHAILNPDEIFVVTDATQDKRFAANELVTGNPIIRFYAGVPLVADNGEALGTLCVLDRESRQLTPDQLRALQSLSRQVMGRLELRRSIIIRDEQYRQLEQYRSLLEDRNAFLVVEASTDNLTGAKNRRAFESILNSEFSMADMEKSPLSLLMIDVDHFKIHNDSFGHLTGDEILRNIAKVI